MIFSKYILPECRELVHSSAVRRAARECGDDGPAEHDRGSERASGENGEWRRECDGEADARRDRDAPDEDALPLPAAHFLRHQLASLRDRAHEPLSTEH